MCLGASIIRHSSHGAALVAKLPTERCGIGLLIGRVAEPASLIATGKCYAFADRRDAVARAHGRITIRIRVSATEGDASVCVCAAEIGCGAAGPIRTIDTTDKLQLIVGVGAKGDAVGGLTPDGAAIEDIAASGRCRVRTRRGRHRRREPRAYFHGVPDGITTVTVRPDVHVQRPRRANSLGEA